MNFSIHRKKYMYIIYIYIYVQMHVYVACGPSAAHKGWGRPGGPRVPTSMQGTSYRASGLDFGLAVLAG